MVANLILRTKCGNWVHGSCMKIRESYDDVGNAFVCSKCREMLEGTGIRSRGIVMKG